jgi:hypothetical protein
VLSSTEANTKEARLSSWNLRRRISRSPIQLSGGKIRRRSRWKKRSENNYNNAGAVAIKDRFEDCAECIHQAWTLNESYVIANGREKAGEAGAAHTEDWWFSNNTISANDDTLLNPVETDGGDLRGKRRRLLRQP